jgi:transposase InsO family protein
MATAPLRRAGLEINAKRVQRLWRQEGLKVPRRQRKRARLGVSENGTQRVAAHGVPFFFAGMTPTMKTPRQVLPGSESQPKFRTRRVITTFTLESGQMGARRR